MGLPSYCWLSKGGVGIWCCSCTHTITNRATQSLPVFPSLSLSRWFSFPVEHGNIETGRGLGGGFRSWLFSGLSSSLRTRCWLACSGSWRWTSPRRRPWPRGPSSSWSRPPWSWRLAPRWWRSWRWSPRRGSPSCLQIPGEQKWVEEIKFQLGRGRLCDKTESSKTADK